MTEIVFHHTHSSPIGDLLLTSDGVSITGIHMDGMGRHPVCPGPGWKRDTAPFEAACEQLQAYFAGARTEFELPLAPRGTLFQRRVWDALLEIPYGETASYGEVARKVGSPRAVRAVGHANGQNPIAIVVPCHRVIGADGSLTGYGGGLERKTFLLGLERRQDGVSPPLVSRERSA